MIPFAYVTGTFYNASGVARANEQITFMPLSTPYAVDGELVLSVPQVVTLNSQGEIHDGAGHLTYKLAKGYYRVIASDTDAFFISVGDDGLDHNISSLASDLGSLPSELKRVLTSREIWSATDDSAVITRSMRGDPWGTYTRMLVMGETGNISADTVFPTFSAKLGVSDAIILGNANPGGSGGTIAAALAPWSSWYGTSNLWYALGSEDWAPGNVTGTLNYTAPPAGARYYKTVIDDGTSRSVALFVIDSNDLEPDGNTAGSTQAIWLQTQLGLSTERWKIVVFRDSPFVSVTGKSKAALDWPFAQWGATAVIAGGAKVSERINLTGGIPLYVCGAGGTAALDTFGTPLSNSVFRNNTYRAGLVITASQSALVFHVVRVNTGEILHSQTLAGADTEKLTWSIAFEWDSGFSIGRNNPSLELEPYGVANFLVNTAQNHVRILNAGVGSVVCMDVVPTATLAAQQPWLKSSLIAVGDDPVRFYWWNRALSDFVVVRFDTYDGVSYYSGARTKLSSPSFTPGVNSFGTVIDHIDQTVEIWVSENGADFARLMDWPTNKLFMFSQPVKGRPTFLAAFARKSGYLDSDIWSSAFTF